MVVSTKEKEFLELLSKPLPEKPSERYKLQMKKGVYIPRMQKRIDKELDNLLWLVRNHPEAFNNGNNKRMKKLMLIVKNLHPKIEVDLVLPIPEIKTGIGTIMTEIPEIKGDRRCRNCGASMIDSNRRILICEKCLPNQRYGMPKRIQQER